jgi:hypothetical protein
MEASVCRSAVPASFAGCDASLLHATTLAGITVRCIPLGSSKFCVDCLAGMPTMRLQVCRLAYTMMHLALTVMPEKW